MNRLRAMEVSSKRLVEVDQTGTGALNDFSWSPDSKWITYTKTSAERHVVGLDLSLRLGSQHPDHRRHDLGVGARPSIPRDASSTSYRPGLQLPGSQSSFESRIYAATLRADYGQVFPPRSDEEPAVTGEMPTAHLVAPRRRSAPPARRISPSGRSPGLGDPGHGPPGDSTPGATRASFPRRRTPLPRRRSAAEVHPGGPEIRPRSSAHQRVRHHP